MEESLGAPNQTLPELDWSILTKNKSSAKSNAGNTGDLPDYIKNMVDLHNSIVQQQKEKREAAIEAAIMPWLLTAEQRRNAKNMKQNK